jgi:hypothetical protein
MMANRQIAGKAMLYVESPSFFENQQSRLWQFERFTLAKKNHVGWFRPIAHVAGLKLNASRVVKVQREQAISNQKTGASVTFYGVFSKSRFGCEIGSDVVDNLC